MPHCQYFLLLLLSLATVSCWPSYEEPNKSDLCVNRDEPKSCSYQLRVKHYGDESCLFEKIESPRREKECVMEPHTQLFPPQDLPFRLSARNRTNWSSLIVPGFNISFPNQTSQSLTFRFHRHSIPEMNLCRKVALHNLALPLHDTIFWDCEIFERTFIDSQLNLTVLDSTGRGGLYTFIVPDGNRIDPDGTELKDWHVFHYLHLEHIQRNRNVPVTLQLAPFTNLTYNVSLIYCQDGFSCSHPILKDNCTVKEPESMNFHKENRPHETVVFSVQEPGIYKITTQISSTHCPAQLCYISDSPRFVVPCNMTLEYLIITSVGIFIILLMFGLSLYELRQKRKVMYTALRENLKKPKLLLVYHCTTIDSFELVKKIAIFLQEASLISPVMIDFDYTGQSPKKWMSEQMETADRVLFFVPEDLKGESVMPIKNQWFYACLYINQYINKAATALIPSSAPVPHQIRHLKRFQLLYDLPSLVTWLHDGTFLERWFLWPSLLEMADNEKNISISLIDLRRALKHRSIHQSSLNDILELRPCKEEPLTKEYYKTEEAQLSSAHNPTPSHAYPSCLSSYVNMDEKPDLIMPGCEFDSDIISVDGVCA